ncbi:hypothetical protein EDB84DRAFT_1439094 [Lactarius hengduanensis]|nr:hypothetical protein EDB84DRAFT_1439094 [Lactarius hengduanensis]
MASDVPPPSPRSDSLGESESTFDVVARVTFHSTIRSSAAKGKKAKTTPAKDTRAKDFSYDFALSEANYYAFLQTILEKHHLLQYKTEADGNTDGDGDVVNFNEYEGLVTKIIKRRPTKAIIVFVDMRAVEKTFSKKKSRNRPFSDDEDGDGLGGDQDDDTDADENLMGLTKIDYELARLRCMLEKKHATNHNGTYAYIDSTTGATVPLTPYMIKEWARAMYNGLTTVNDPPQTTTFDQKTASLHSVLGTVPAARHPLLVVPSDNQPPVPLNSPPVIFNTPSKLERFLQAAESNGVPELQSHHSSLSLKGYGPDIMHLISVPDLVEVGILPGEAIRLKEYASKWWAQEHQRVTKRSHSHISDIAQVHLPLQTGSSGLAPIGTYDTDDYAWWVYSRELKEYVPLPPGKVPVFNDPGPPELLVDGKGCDGAPPAPGLAQGI